LTEDEVANLQARLRNKLSEDDLETLGEGGLIVSGNTNESPRQIEGVPHTLVLKRCAADDGLLLTWAASNQKLRTVMLEDNLLSFDCVTEIVKALASNRLGALQALCIRWNPIKAEGAAAIATALRTNTTLRSLDLVSSEVGTFGAMALGHSLKHNQYLTALDLDSNAIGPCGVQALPAALSQNQSLLTLRLNRNGLGPTGAEHVAELLRVNGSVTALHVCGNSFKEGGASALAAALPLNCALTALHLADNDIADDGAAALAHGISASAALGTLALARNKIGPGGATALASALREGGLRELLDLNYNRVGHDGAAAIAAGLSARTSRLGALQLRSNGLGDEGVEALCLAVEKGRVLKLDLNNNGVKEEGARRLVAALCSGECCLRHLDVGWNGIGDGGAAGLAEVLSGGSKSLLEGSEWLERGSAKLEGDSDAAGKGKGGRGSSLTWLDMNRSEVGVEGANAILASLQYNSSLTTLHLCANNIDEQARQVLVRAVECCPEAVEELPATHVLAVMMGLHRRLGRDSGLAQLDELLCRFILDWTAMATPRTIRL